MSIPREYPNEEITNFMFKYREKNKVKSETNTNNNNNNNNDNNNVIKRSLGVFLTLSNEMPKNKMPVFDIDNIINVTDNNHDHTQHNLYGNEYNILSFVQDGSYILKFDERQFELMNDSGKVVTNIGDNLELYVPNNNASQKIKYNAVGNLIINNLCVTSDINTSNIYLDKCYNTTNSMNQNWTLFENNIKKMGSNNCLNYTTQNNKKNDRLILSTCDEDTKWIFKNADYDLKDWNWQKNKDGKVLVLAENNNPWFVSKDIVKEISIDRPNNPTSYPSIYSSLSTSTSTSTSTPTSKAPYIEEFYGDSTENNDINTFIFILIICIIIYIIIIAYK